LGWLVDIAHASCCPDQLPATGPAVTAFVPGDEVIGYVRKDHVQHGCYAELVAAADRVLARKPRSLSFEQAGGLPLAGLTALQALRAAGVGDGDTVLVHAAAGGVGHLAVQIALALGAARVIGTASAHNHEFLRSLGAQPVSYGPGLAAALAEIVGGDGTVDVVLDTVGGDTLAAAPALVRDRSRVVSITDASTALTNGGKYVFVRPNSDDLSWLGQLADAGRLRVEVQQTFPLAAAPGEQALLEGGHVRGKLVLVTGAP